MEREYVVGKDGEHCYGMVLSSILTKALCNHLGFAVKTQSLV